MKVLVVDDEPLACDRLVRMLAETAGFDCIAQAANGHEALALADRHKPDLVLMDVRMPGMDGLEAARHLAVLENPPAVIFTTAHSDHALEAFDAHAVGYVLKPVRREKLERAMQSATRRSTAQQYEQSGRRTHIATTIGHQLTLIPVDDIFFFRAEHKYVTLVHKSGEAVIEESLRRLEEEFSGHFLRVHRQTLASLRHTSGMEKTPEGKFRLLLSGSQARPEISRRHLQIVRKALKESEHRPTSDSTR